MRWNYGAIDPSKLPRLTHSGLDTDDLADALGMLPALVQSGLLTPDDDLERAIRERLGAGDLPEGASRTAQERTTPAALSPVASLAEQLIRRRHGSQG